MKRLSTTASAKLAKIGRTETADTADSLRDLLIKHDMFPFGPVVDTFLHFGGYTLPFPLEGRFKIYRLKDAIKSMTYHSVKARRYNPIFGSMAWDIFTTTERRWSMASSSGSKIGREIRQ
jgi:hypothetical protein